MSELNNKRIIYAYAVKELDRLEFKANNIFKQAFPKRSEVLFKRQSEGKLYRGFVLEVYACGRFRKVWVKNCDTGSTYWVDSSWLYIDENERYDTSSC